VADIHFDYRLAVSAMENGADGIRINPGNIGSRKKVETVARAAREAKVPIRIGVNLGSVKKSILEEFGEDHVGALVENARQYADMLRDMGVEDLKVSLKSSDVLETVDAYRRFAQQSDLPLHLGLTEAGTPFAGAIRSAAGIGALLIDGIGDTVRISLAGDPVQEVLAARVLLESVGLRKEGVRVIACPTCARTCGDVAAIASEVEEALREVKRHLVVAVMGCVVNGPGEARIADLGVACDKGGAMLFVRGKPIRRIAASEITNCLMDEIEKELVK
jgi:(E)-4-hydroxy-3-methylbut-2-enyl-diphosphate synthase